MPKESYYDGLVLSEAIEALAEHHYEQRTRHLSTIEYEMLRRAAEQLRTSEAA